MVKNLPANSKRQKRLGFNSESGRCPGGDPGNPLQYSCLRIPWTEEPGRLQSMGSQRVRHNWSDLACSLAMPSITWLCWTQNIPTSLTTVPSLLYFSLYIYICVCVCVCVFILNPQSYILWKATGESCTREQLLYILLLWFHFPRKAYILLGHPGKQGFTAWGFHFITLCTGSRISVTVIHDKSMSFVRRCALRFLLRALTK